MSALPMNEHLNYIFQQIEKINPIHSKKLNKNLSFYDQTYFNLAEEFFKKYIKYLNEHGKDFDYGIRCYLNMVADMNMETVKFFRTGKYSSSTFEEVNQRVYATPEVMEYYQHGLIMSQFLWKHHYQILNYFISNLPKYLSTQTYLEIGVGHGLYLNNALEILNPNTRFTAVDISKTSIELAKNFTNDSRVEFNLKNIFDFNNDQKFDFITMGEVLEHVEEPLKLLQKLHQILTPNGVLFITVPANAPAIDHIYLFNNVKEIQDMCKAAGFKIESDESFFSEDVSPEKAEKLKITIMYAAFLRKA